MCLYITHEAVARFAIENGMFELGDDFFNALAMKGYRGDISIDAFVNPPSWGVEPEFCEAVIKHFWGRPIPEVQLRTAQALASAYNHAWGFIDLDTLPEFTQVEIWKACQKLERSMKGIDAPDVDDVGTISHTTGSGRLKWIVDPDGSTMLDIYRPDSSDAILSVAFRKEGEIYEESQMSIWYDEWRQFYWRHIVALEEAARVVNTHLQCVSEKEFEKRMAILADQSWPDFADSEDVNELPDILNLLRQGYVEAGISLMKARLTPVRQDGYVLYELPGSKVVFEVNDTTVKYGYGRFTQTWSR